MNKKALSILLCLCLLLTLGSGAAFAGDNTPTFKALSNTETALYGYTEPEDVYILLKNTLDTDVEITKVESTNEDDFTANTDGFTVKAGESYKFEVSLDTGKDVGTYEATYTFTDSAGSTYTAIAKVNVVEDVALTQEKMEPVVWDYEDSISAKVLIENCTKSEVNLVKVESSSNEFELTELFDEEEESLAIASTESAEYEVLLPTGKDVGTYTTILTFTDEGGETYDVDVSVEVVKRLLSVPTVVGEYVYNGKMQPLIFDENWNEKYMGVALNVADGIQSYVQAKTAGHYAPVLVLKDKKNTAWLIDETETTLNQTLSWDIAKYQLIKPKLAETTYIDDEGQDQPGYVYTGTEQTVVFDDYTDSVFVDTPQETEVLAVTGRTKTNAGTTTVTVSILDTTNFEWVDGTDAALTFTWVMDRAKVAEPKTEKTTFDYNGSAQSIIFEEGSIIDELMSVTNNSRTEIGTQTVTVSLKDKVNYEWKNGTDADLTFTLAVGTPVYSLPTIVGTYTYNAQTQHPEFTGFDDEHMTVTDNSGKNAGDYTVTISLKDKAHATWADTNTSEDREITWMIEKAKVTVEAADKTAKTGDPVPTLNADDYTITGIIWPDSLGFIPTIGYNETPDMSKEGTYDIIVSGAATSTDGNYAVEYKNAKLTVGDTQIVDAIKEIGITFDLPLAGSKKMSTAIDNIKVSSYYAGVSFGTSDGEIAVYEQGTDTDLTSDVEENGLTEGAKVYLKISVPTNSGKFIVSGTTKVTINGAALIAEDVKTLSEGGEVNYAFSVPAYRIHFKAGEGSGSMATQYADGTAPYTIPVCTFTAPAGKEFDKWQLEGSATTYVPGEKITLTGSINLAAVYKDKTTAPTTPSGGSGGGGGFIGGGGLPSEVTPVNPVTKVQEPIVKIENGTYAISKDGTAVTFTPVAGYIIMDVAVNGVSIGDVESVTGLVTGDVVECIVQNKAGMQAEMNKYQLVARSAMSKAQGKKAVKITWYDANGKKLSFDGVEIFRSVKRYSGYGTKPFFTTTKAQYHNTAIQAGTKYYYKVRGYVWFDGMKVYTDWSLKAWRTVK